MQLQHFVMTALAATVLAGPPACPSNESWTRGIRCVEGCLNARCPPPCPPFYEHGCFCVDGYFRNAETNECVKRDDCPAMTCHH